TSNTVGVFYWQAVYSGDANNAGATSVCGDEQLSVATSDVPMLLVKKHVINDNGAIDANRQASNFALFIRDTTTGYAFIVFFSAIDAALYTLSLHDTPPLFTSNADGALD